jgi:hypothetical protein
MVSGIQEHEIYDQLGDLRLEAFALKEEILRLKKENLKLKDQIASKEKAVFKNDCYYFDDDGPYCPRCFDTKGMKVRMLESDNNMGTKFNRCPECNTQTVKENYQIETFEESYIPTGYL